MRKRVVLRGAGVAAMASACGLAQGQLCQPRWAQEFQSGDPTGVIYAQAVFDDGTGPRLYAAGAGAVWRWDGQAWASVGAVQGGGTFLPTAYAMAVYDEDGAGPNPPRLFVGGDFGSVGGAPAQNVARYDGAAWSGVGAGVTISPFSPSAQMVRALYVFDDGAGPALYIGGGFNRAGGLTANRVARWNGAGYSVLGSGLTGGTTDSAVFALCGFDEDGAGPNPARLFAAGGFTTSGTTQVPGAARWTGSAWTGLGAGLSSNRAARAMAVYDDGAGPKLYFGGDFTGSGTLQSFGIIRWSGAAWSQLPSSPGLNYGVNGACYALLPVPGEGLYVGGWFTVAGNQQNVGAIARYTSGTWERVGGGVTAPSSESGNFRSLARHDDGRGAAVFAGGNLSIVEGLGVSNTARWTGTAWTPVGRERRGMLGYAYAHKVLDAGDGPAMYLSGIGSLGGLHVGGAVAKWDGNAWSALRPLAVGAGAARALEVYNDGTGAALYMTYPLYTTEWNGAVARWNGTAWVQVGGAFERAGGGGAPGDLMEFDDGSGPALWSFGSYDTVGGAAATGTAKLVEGRWVPTDFMHLAGQLSGVGPYFADLRRFGGSLYIVGYFTSVNGVPALGAARWTAGQWIAVGPPAAGQMVRIMEVDLGSGPMLIGNTNAFPNPVYQLAGNAWAPLGPTCPVGFGPLEVFDDGTGRALYTSGSGASGSPLLYRLRGNQWQPISPGLMPGGANSLVSFDDRGARAPALWLTGTFQSAGGVASENIARLEGCAGLCYANCDASTSLPVLNVLDFTCFVGRFAAGDPAANCDASTTSPVLNVLDFVCFLNRFAAGCG